MSQESLNMSMSGKQYAILPKPLASRNPEAEQAAQGAADGVKTETGKQWEVKGKDGKKEFCFSPSEPLRGMGFTNVAATGTVKATPAAGSKPDGRQRCLKGYEECEASTYHHKALMAGIAKLFKAAKAVVLEHFYGVRPEELEQIRIKVYEEQKDLNKNNYAQYRRDLNEAKVIGVC